MRLNEKPIGDNFNITIHPIKYHGKMEVSKDGPINLNAIISVSTIEMQPSVAVDKKENIITLEQLIEEELNKEFEDILEDFKI